MIVENRGDQIVFTQTFYDADNNITDVGSATVTLIYPSSTPSGALLSRDPGQLKGKGTLTMAQDDNGVWTATWDSSIADPGVIYWNIKSANPTISEDGKFVLRGNLANLEAF